MLTLMFGCGPNGEYRTYYEGGQLKTVKNFKNGKLDGVLIDYYANGNKSSETSYVDGKIDGLPAAFVGVPGTTPERR